jgi:RNA polymerase sigma factor (sigma-70 family)
MLEKISLNHKLWQKMAYKLCKDKYLADDIVSEMYLKLADCSKELNEFYIYQVLRSCFIDWIRNEKKLEFSEITENLIIIEEEKKEKETRVIPEIFSFSEKEILKLRQDYSLRQIAKAYDMCYGKVYRIEKQANKKIQKWQKANQNQLQQL